MYPTLQDIFASVSYANPLGLKISFSFFIGALVLWKFRLALARNVHWILGGMVLLGLLEVLALANAVHEAESAAMIWDGLDSSARLNLATLPLLTIAAIAPAGAAVGLLCVVSGLTRKVIFAGVLLMALSLTYFGLGHWLCEVLLD